MAEVIATAAATGTHMHLCHVNSTSLRHMDQVLDAIRHAQQQGLKITTEMYPYGAGSTVIGAAFAAPEALPLLGIEATDIYNVSTGCWISSSEELVLVQQQHPGDLAIFHFLNENKPEDRVLLEHALAFPNVAIASDAIPFTVNADPWKEMSGRYQRTLWPILGEALLAWPDLGSWLIAVCTLLLLTGVIRAALAIRTAGILCSS